MHPKLGKRLNLLEQQVHALEQVTSFLQSLLKARDMS
jgi:hypothetical protein